MVLPKRATAAFILLVFALSAFPVVVGAPAKAASASGPVALEVQSVPSVLPADGGAYPAIYVSLLDSSGSPTLAVTNLTVYLSSSTPTVGVVLNSTVVISAGHGYTIATFRSTPTAGSTQITASASGLQSTTVKVSTAAFVGYPTSISLTPVPSEVNSTSTSSRTGTVIVELQDQGGLPAKAATDTVVSVYSSSPTILTLNMSSFTMNAGQLFKVLSFTTGLVPGSAVITASAPQLATGSAQVNVLGRPPLALKLQAQPDSLVTSGSGRLVVALTDLKGEPTRAPTDIVVQLRSSDSSAVSVPATATISAGTIYTTVTIGAGVSPDPAGVTITASSSGLTSGFVSVTTSSPSGPPVALALYVGPSTVLADHGDYYDVVASLVNATGGQTVAGTSSYSVILTSSHNSSVGSFGTASFTQMMIAGSTANNVVWQVPFTSTFVPGTTYLTASAEDLLPATGSVTTYGPVPERVAVSSLFNAVPADGAAHPALEVSLEDSQGGPAVAPSPITVYLASSQTGILQVSSPIVISPGSSAVMTDVVSTSASGTANITAYTSSLGSGYTSSSVLVQTVTPSPSAIGAYLAPAVFSPSYGQNGTALVLQLLGSGSNPAKAREPTTLTVTSSDTSVFNQTLSVLIPQGESFVRVPIVPLGSGTTTFTVTSPGLATASAKLEALPSSVSTSLVTNSVVMVAGETNGVTLRVMVDGQGASSGSVTWSATGGTISPAASTLNAGVATAVFKPTTTGVAKITAQVTSPILGSKTLSTEVITNPAHQQTVGFLTNLLSFPYILVLVGVVAAVVLLSFLLVRRRRRRGSEADALLSEDEQGFAFVRLAPKAPWGAS